MVKPGARRLSGQLAAYALSQAISGNLSRCQPMSAKPGGGCRGFGAVPAQAQPGRCENVRSNTPSAIRFFRISTEPPAIIQPRQRRMQYSTSDSWL